MDHFEKAKQFFFEGLRLLEANDLQAAETQFARSLELLPDRVSTLNNLSAVKIRLEKFAEAEELARKAIAVENNSPEAWSNLGIALTGMERNEEALQAFDRAIDYNSSHALAWKAKATTLLKLTRYDEALLAYDQALNLDPGKYEMVYAKSQILKGLNRPDEAQTIYLKSLKMRVASSPVFPFKRRATQKGDVLVVNQNPTIDDSLKSFEDLHLHCLNYPGQLPQCMSEDFHFSYVFVGDAVRPSSRQQIPKPDIVINNNVNGEVIVSGGGLWEIVEVVDSFGVPVVNHPNNAVQTTRDGSAKLLDGLSGVIVPKVMRFSSIGKTREELVHEIEEHYNYPLITRTLTSQMGIGMLKLDSREALTKLLSTDYPKDFYVTHFVDSRGDSEIFRKVRAAIVKDEMFIIRVDYDHFWNVQGRKTDERVAYFSDKQFLLEDEIRICSDPEAALGRPAMQSLQNIRDRFPLEVFGIDFDVNPDGQAVFYEANASMNLFSTARKEIPYPKEQEDCMKQAFNRYFTSLLASR